MNVDAIDGRSSDSFEGFESEGKEAKDITEFELEKAVFGDQAGFYEQLKEHGISRDIRNQPGMIQKDVEDAADDLHLLDDADVSSSAAGVELALKRSSFQAIRHRFWTDCADLSSGIVTSRAGVFFGQVRSSLAR